MNSFKLLFLALATCIFISCGGDEEPMSSDSCPEEVSFNLDGVNKTLPILAMSQDPAATFILKDPSPFDPQGVSRAFFLRLQSAGSQSDIEVFDIVLEIGVDDENSCIEPGVYETGSLNGEAVLSFLYVNGLTSFSDGFGQGAGRLEITKCDFDNRLISGDFSATLVDFSGSTSLEITNGVFEDVCFDI
jgi:hypothetical protein